MLVLSRRKRESIVINGEIIVTFLGMRKGKAAIGIEAPRGITVHREEIQRQIDSTDNHDNPKED